MRSSHHHEFGGANPDVWASMLAAAAATTLVTTATSQARVGKEESLEGVAALSRSSTAAPVLEVNSPEARGSQKRSERSPDNLA